jgi:hypothetical protein
MIFLRTNVKLDGSNFLAALLGGLLYRERQGAKYPHVQSGRARLGHFLLHSFYATRDW